jgi:uncharacterized membrane protein YfcA
LVGLPNGTSAIAANPGAGSVSLILLVLAIGISAGFFSGLLGLGGGLLMTPLFLYAPGWAGFSALPVKQITGLTMVQGFAGAISGLTRHQSYGFVSWRLVRYLGMSAGASALAGAIISRWMPDEGILAIFGAMALIAAALIFLPGARSSPDREAQDQPEPTEFSFNAPLAIGLGCFIGFTGGLVGQAGSFLLIPTMLYVLNVPTRMAIGSNLGIILFSAVAGLAGKVTTAQVPFELALVMVAGSVPSAYLGAIVSRRLRPRLLRYALAGVVAVAAVRIWVDVLF